MFFVSLCVTSRQKIIREKSLITIILIIFLTFVNDAAFDQMIYERQVVIKYAVPGSNPAQANKQLEEDINQKENELLEL